MSPPQRFAAIAWPLIAALKPRRQEQPMTTTDRPTSQGAPWTSHGHAIDGITVDGPVRPDLVARCGGPALCATCAADEARIRREAQP